ncbi:hypothetical protein LCGC14_1595360 [marine sediment metagenome]|uniref:Uncharacterized protein n=1 Tax=marine sediment metagenome TaxID=412755 RepID=A0A0F9KTH1_9ZZZZ
MKIKLWIKKLFKKPEQKPVTKHFSMESQEDRDREIKELMLLQDPICGKHHG